MPQFIQAPKLYRVNELSPLLSTLAHIVCFAFARQTTTATNPRRAWRGITKFHPIQPLGSPPSVASASRKFLASFRTKTTHKQRRWRSRSLFLSQIVFVPTHCYYRPLSPTVFFSPFGGKERNENDLQCSRSLAAAENYYTRRLERKGIYFFQAIETRRANGQMCTHLTSFIFLCVIQQSIIHSKIISLLLAIIIIFFKLREIYKRSL